MFLSGGAAAMNLVLAANAMGYATNWITNWYSDVEEGRRILGLAPHERVVGFVHIGTFSGSRSRAAAARDQPRSYADYRRSRGKVESAMFYEPEQGHGLPHDPFKAIVAPRPIGWISTLSAAGEVNLAPYSFFNAFSTASLLVWFSSGGPRTARLRRRERRIRRQSGRLDLAGEDERTPRSTPRAASASSALPA